MILFSLGDTSSWIRNGNSCPTRDRISGVW